MIAEYRNAECGTKLGNAECGIDECGMRIEKRGKTQGKAIADKDCEGRGSQGASTRNAIALAIFVLVS